MASYKDEFAEASPELHSELGGGATLDFGSQTSIPCTLQELPAGLDLVPGGFIDADSITVSVAKASFTGTWPVEGSTVVLNVTTVGDVAATRTKQVKRVAGANDPALPDLELQLGVFER